MRLGDFTYDKKMKKPQACGQFEIKNLKETLLNINDIIMRIDLIKDKTDWLRQLRPKRAKAGLLTSKGDCKSMSSTILRWNKTEGRERDCVIKHLTDNESFVIVAWIEPIRKEVRYGI